MQEKDLLESFAAELSAFSPNKLDQLQTSPEDTFAVFTQATLALKTDRRKIALDVLVIISRMKNVWTRKDLDDEIYGTLLDLFFSGNLTDKENISCLRCLANIPLQNQKISIPHFSSFAREFSDAVRHMTLDYSFQQFIFLRVAVLGTIVSQTFKEAFAEEIDVFFKWTKNAFNTQTEHQIPIICELIKLIYASFCVEKISSSSEHCDRLVRLVSDLIVFIQSGISPDLKLVDKLVQCCERLPPSRYKEAFNLPLSKSAASSKDDPISFPELDLLFDEFERQLRRQPLVEFDMLSSYLKVVCQLIIASRHARKTFKKRLRLSDRDFFQLPNEGDSLASILISLFTNPDIIIKTLAAQIFFIIAKQNVQRFIDMTGYGNAAGLLYQNGFLTKGFTPDDGDDYSDDDDDQQREKLVSYQMNKKKNEKKFENPVMNPITGRLEESAIKDKFANLSPEQKEYEAHHLANIFSKMSTGALRPMAIDKEGKLTPVDQMAHQTVLDSKHSDSED